MLVLQRVSGKGESIILHDAETGKVLAAITVLSTRGSKVKLGIEAPKGVSIHRNEAFDKLTNGSLTNGRKRR